MKKKFYLSIFALVLCISFTYGQLAGSVTYDFRDGTIITAGKSADGLLTLSGGSYKLHGAQYGLNMKVGGEIKITVTGSRTIRFLGSKYSGLKMTGTAVTEADLGTQNTQVTTDMTDSYDFVYSGGAATLSFKTIAGTGNDLYLPTIEIIPSQSGATATATVKNIANHYDFRDGSIVPTTTDGKSDITKGLVSIKVGSKNAYGYNGAQHGCQFKEENQINLQVSGNSYIKIGGCQYSTGGIINVSSTTGRFDKPSQTNQTAKCYDADGSSVKFLYVGTSGSVTLNFTGSNNYIPYIEVVPVPYAVELDPWVAKSGTITVNGKTITLTAGATSTDKTTVTLSEGTVISATADIASVRINLGGKALSTYAPAVSGQVASAVVAGDTLKITYADATTKPKSYKILVADNSIVPKSEAGKTYTYNLADGSVLPQTSYTALRYAMFVTKDGIVTLKSNTETNAGKFGYHDSTHGAVMFPGNSCDIIVPGNATISFIVCQYGSATDAIFEFKDSKGVVLGSCEARDSKGVDGTVKSFAYTGPAGVITATLKSTSFPTAEIYIHGLSIENAAKVEVSNGLPDSWDFGAAQLDATLFNNKLNETIINSWYASTIAVGSASTTNAFPSFTAGILSWVGGSNDRLRTSNTALTRYDSGSDATIESETLKGSIYVNSGAATGRYLSLTLSEDDEVTLYVKTQSGTGKLNFQYVNAPIAQTDIAVVNSTAGMIVKFTAKSAGTYHIFDSSDKPSYYRVIRKDATYQTIAGTVDVSAAAGIQSGYGIIFKNTAGKTWKSVVSNGAFSMKVPVGNNYSLSLADANGFIISNGSSLDVTATTSTYKVVIKKVELYTVTGAITGLDAKIANLSLIYTPDPAANKIYKPEPKIDVNAKTYSVQLEPNCAYSFTANGVNDYLIPKNTITIGASNTTAEIAFSAKTLYKVTINATGLNAEQLAKLSLTFNNLNETGYSYSFTSVSGISLRDGTYSIAYAGLDEYPVVLGLTSNIKISGADATKNLVFSPVTLWSFDDKAIASGATSYEGLIFTGTVTSEVAKGHLTAKSGATIKIPVKVGDKIRVTYYYSADFSIEGGTAITTASASTSKFEYAEYAYTGNQAGFVTITIGAGATTTYIPEIEIGGSVAYKSIIYVGANKDYKTINAALTAIGKMIRPNNERVTVMIDPGNYEEMLVISAPNITLKNAAATPSIALANKGVDIAAGAVRITSYYGQYYSYYSMGTNQKWNAEILRVNKENGSLSYENQGGTTNGSYWNATVVVSANGFVAEDLILENSFNQYISKKESEDVVVGNKNGVRPTDIGNVNVQKRSFVTQAAAIGITNNTDKVVLNKCRVIGRQDSFYGGTGTRVVVYKGAMMGAVDYLYGGMTAVFYKTDLVMNVSDDSSDASYLTAAQQSSGRGYLMYQCTVKAAVPGTETASTFLAKPGYFGRPWAATTSEVVFFNTTIETTNFTGSEGKSLIAPAGWNNSLSGTSKMMYEYGTTEKSGENNSSSRASWATLLTAPTLTDGTAITTLNFTKGTDGWDPLPALIAADVTGISIALPVSSVKVYAYGSRIYVSNVKSNTIINIYSITGALMQTLQTNSDTNFDFNKSGIWIVKVNAADGQKAVKVLTR